VHHTAVPEPTLAGGSPEAEAAHMRDLESLHLDRGWAAIGYHFVVMPSGRIYAGRPAEAVGAHVEGHNLDTIGVALAGDFEREKPTSEAVTALERVKALVPGASTVPVLPHRDLASTRCPGRFLAESLPRGGV
jgi:N-acetylmuramoyl-L-alanine amidase